jgi:aspartate/methionine/tyrosine aminotransferase
MRSLTSGRALGIEKTLLRRINDLADSSCINLGLGEPSFPTPKALRGILKENVDDWHLGYSPNAGLRELQEIIAEKSGLRVTADQVCVTVGSEEALFVALLVIVNPEDEVLIPDPGFPTYESVTKIAGGTPKKYPLHPDNNFSLRAEDIEDLLTDKTKAIILNSPNNPSGAVYSRLELEKLARILIEKNIIAISDEAYCDIYFDERPDSIANHMPTCVVLNSLSKSYSMTGWRLGWCIFPAELSKPFIGVHQMAVMCAPVLSQRVALFALRGAADQEKSENIEDLRRRRDLAISCVEKYTSLKYIKPSGTFYLLLDVSDKAAQHGTSLEISLSLLKKEKMVTIPGTAFGKGGEGFLRISFAASPENIEEGIRRIGRHFKSKP